MNDFFCVVMIINDVNDELNEKLKRKMIGNEWKWENEWENEEKMKILNFMKIEMKQYEKEC